MSMQAYFGTGQIESLPELVSQLGSQRVLVVRSTKAYEKSEARTYVDCLRKQLNVSDFFGFRHNPDVEDVKRGVALLKELNPDLIIAIGGGSAIDMAKLINAAGLLDGEVFLEAVKKGHQINEVYCPLIAIPTTAGTGSEVTSFAVAYINNIKFSLAGPALLPDYSIVDSQLTYDMPAELTAQCGLDALCQGIESYWNVSATPQSREHAKKAVEYAVRYLASAVNSPTPESREGMCIASHAAGKAINLTKTTAPHAISYPLTTHFGLAHGHAVAVSLAEFIALNYPDDESYNNRLNPGVTVEGLKRDMHELFSLMGVTSMESACEWFYDLVNRIGLELSLEKLGVQESDFPHILAEISIERLNNNPVIVSEDDIRKVLSQPVLKACSG